MSETMMTAGGAQATVSVSDIPPGTAVNEASESQTTGVGSGTELGADTGSQSDNAGGEQSTSEDGQSQAGQRRTHTKLDEIRELRAWRREARQRETAYQSELQQMRQQLEELRQQSQPGQRKTARNPAEFWQDPEARIQNALDERLERLEGSLLERFSMSREQEAQQMALRQEQESAVEFIRSQPNYSPEDDDDIIDIIETIPNRENLSPSWVAEYAWMKLNQERGISDKSVAKARASTVIGQPPGVGLSGKIWSKAEFDRTVDALEKQGARADSKLLAELEAAVKENRVR